MLDEEYIRMQALAKQQTQQLYNSSQMQARIQKTGSHRMNGVLEEPELEPLLLAAGEASPASVSSPATSGLKISTSKRCRSRKRKTASSKENSPLVMSEYNPQKQFQYHPYNPNKDNNGSASNDANNAFL